MNHQSIHLNITSDPDVDTDKNILDPYILQPKTSCPIDMKKKKLFEIDSNPFGIQPWGNYYLKSFVYIDAEFDVRNSGLGKFRCLEDEQIVQHILTHLDAKDLAILAQVSRSLYIFSHTSSLWKQLTLNEFSSWEFVSNWRETFIKSFLDRKSSTLPLQPYSHSLVIKNNPIRIEGFYSDYLHEEWQCALVDLSIWETGCLDNIDRVSGLSFDQFQQRYSYPNFPVVITDIIPTWRAWDFWTTDLLMARFSDPTQTFQVGSVSMSLASYFQYCHQQKDEIPLYLFDNQFGEKYPGLLDDYQVPLYFSMDYFSLFPQDIRPSYRWFFAGPARSGSTFHKDPNATSAWNALLKGKKLWIMYPPDITPPGVHPSSDEMNVVTPVSVVEWMIRFYKDAKKRKIKPYECIQYPGDLVYIPHGWWHQVINLEDCIGVTQNVVNDANLNQVIRFLKAKTKPTLWIAFEKLMQNLHPDKLKQFARNTSSSISFDKSRGLDETDGNLEKKEIKKRRLRTKGFSDGSDIWTPKSFKILNQHL